MFPLRVYFYLYLTATHLNRSPPRFIFLLPPIFTFSQFSGVYACSERSIPPSLTRSYFENTLGHSTHNLCAPSHSPRSISRTHSHQPLTTLLPDLWIFSQSFIRQKGTPPSVFRATLPHCSPTRRRTLFDARDAASFLPKLRATLPAIKELAERSEKVFPLYDYLNGLSKETSR